MPQKGIQVRRGSSSKRNSVLWIFQHNRTRGEDSRKGKETKGNNHQGEGLKRKKPAVDAIAPLEIF